VASVEPAAVVGGSHLAPEGVFPFRPWRGKPLHCPVLLLRCPSEVRIEIERDGAATMAAHFAGDR
jgi:hypothetical protein